MARSDFTYEYQTSPIILVNGIAGVGSLPLTSILNAPNYQSGVTGPSTATNTNTSSNNTSSQSAPTYVNFNVLPGGTLMRNAVAEYPLANQATAANAIITEPLNIEVEMIFPATGDLPFEARRLLITAMKSSLDNHTALGGWYNVQTPAFIYAGCLLVDLIDSTTESGEGSQPQSRWVWSFHVPLLTQAQADTAQAQAMNKISTQTQNTGNPPGSQPVSTALGQPASGISSSLIPAAQDSSSSSLTFSGNFNSTPSVSNVSPILPGS